jgi:hypothetical protein
MFCLNQNRTHCGVRISHNSYATSGCLQVVIAALRQLEAALASCGAPCSSFTGQALQGILLKALVPLTNPKTLPAAEPSAAASEDLSSSSLSLRASNNACDREVAGSSRSTPAAVTQQQQLLLRLLQLPERYNPLQLPQGSQVLPAPPHAAAAAVAPVHQAVEKDAVRLQASGEALFAGDVAARMKRGVLYLASECVPDLSCVRVSTIICC